MLVYHPMLDPYHGALRLACILLDSAETEMEWDRVRLLDFFVVFPHLIEKIRLPRNLSGTRKVFRGLPQPYEALPSRAKLFFQLGEIQQPAVRLLSAGGVISDDAFRKGVFSFAFEKAPAPLQDLADRLHYRSSDWYAFLIRQLADVPLHGQDGLKERSGVMEFRHDVG